MGSDSFRPSEETSRLVDDLSIMLRVNCLILATKDSSEEAGFVWFRVDGQTINWFGWLCESERLTGERCWLTNAILELLVELLAAFHDKIIVHF